MHWGRAFVGGVLVIAIGIPIGGASLTLLGDQARYEAPVVSFVLTFVFAYWVCNKVESKFVLHGVLVAVIAILVFTSLSWGNPLPAVYVVAHALKIVAGAWGGYAALKRKDRHLDTHAHR